MAAGERDVRLERAGPAEVVQVAEAVNSLAGALAAVVAEAGQVWRGRCATTGQQLVVEVPDAPVVVQTDPVRVRQVIDDLAENAVRACMITPGGGGGWLRRRRP